MHTLLVHKQTMCFKSILHTLCNMLATRLDLGFKLNNVFSVKTLRYWNLKNDIGFAKYSLKGK